jgi:hypothetical protein
MVMAYKRKGRLSIGVYLSAGLVLGPWLFTDFIAVRPLNR